MAPRHPCAAGGGAPRGPTQRESRSRPWCTLPGAPSWRTVPCYRGDPTVSRTNSGGACWYLRGERIDPDAGGWRAPAFRMRQASATRRKPRGFAIGATAGRCGSPCARARIAHGRCQAVPEKEQARNARCRASPPLRVIIRGTRSFPASRAETGPRCAHSVARTPERPWLGTGGASYVDFATSSTGSPGGAFDSFHPLHVATQNA